nr:MAG TPA: hypothetical protein [Crassvirales sp.]
MNRTQIKEFLWGCLRMVPPTLLKKGRLLK